METTPKHTKNPQDEPSRRAGHQTRWKAMLREAPSGSQTFETPSLVSRAGAYIIDRIFIYGITIPVSIILIWNQLQAWADELILRGLTEGDTTALIQAMFEIMDAGSIAKIAAVTGAVFAVTSALYSIPQHALFGQTIGKRITGIKAVRFEETNPKTRGLGWWVAAKRWTAPAATMFMGGYGLVATGAIYGWVFSNPWRRGLHDVIGGTWVVVKPKKQASWEPQDSTEQNQPEQNHPEERHPEEE